MSWERKRVNREMYTLEQIERITPVRISKTTQKTLFINNNNRNTIITIAIGVPAKNVH